MLGRLLIIGGSAFVTFWLLANQVGFGGDEIPDAEFKPKMEADMPEGFPSFTPVGSVEVKEYPAYRKAVTSAKSGVAFWTLFAHIKRNGIAMTTPVEMGFDDDSETNEADSMAFLYGDRNRGRLGTQGGAEVLDVPRMFVVSTGVRGLRSEQAIQSAKDRLEEWLDRNQARYARSGPLRVMAYNSPFVPRDQNFFEVQIPVRPVES